jgi:DNA primase catalytic core
LKIANLDEIKSQLRPFLSEYLKIHGIDTSLSKHFKCPNYKAHKNNDETPAAGFFPDDEHYNCFVCSSAGDIFTASYHLEEKPLKGAEFITENLLYLAKKFKVHYEIIEETEDEKKNKYLYRVIELVAKVSHLYFTQKSGAKIKKYVEDRGWGSITKSFYIGHIGSNELYRLMLKNGINEETLKEVGINIIKNEDGTVYIPIIENRILIPYRNYFGKISSIIGRGISDDVKPKYMFTPNTAIHNRSKELFNLNEAKKYSKEIYIVESNASVLSMYASEIKNVVALSGKDMNPEQYDLLVRMGIEKIILCLDNDDVGIAAMEKIVYDYKDKSDFSTYIKELPRIDEVEDKNLKDPDDFIKKYGVEKFINIPELSAFDWFLNKFANDNEDDASKEIIMSLILSEKNFLKRERLVKRFSEKAKFTQKTILLEIEQYSSKKDLITSVREVIEAKESLINDIDDFEEVVWSRKDELLGFDTGWPMFNKFFDGLQEGFLILGGRTNIGKSALMLSLVMNLLKKNQSKIYILYFSIDDSIRKCVGRLFAMESRVPINWIKNPKYKIKLNPAFTEEEKDILFAKRDKAVSYVKSLSNSFAFKSIKVVEEMEKLIKTYYSIAESESKKLVVFVDKIHNVSSYKTYEKRSLTDYVSVCLKGLSNAYSLPIIGSFEVTKSSIMGRPTEEHIKETQKLEDDSDATILLYSESKIKTDTMFTFTDADKQLPIVEMIVPKNKLSDIAGYDCKIFYRFYPHFGIMEECGEEEQKYYASL